MRASEKRYSVFKGDTMLIKVTKGKYKNLLGYIGTNGEVDLYQGSRRILTTLKSNEYKIISKGEE